MPLLALTAAAAFVRTMSAAPRPSFMYVMADDLDGDWKHPHWQFMTNLTGDLRQTPAQPRRAHGGLLKGGTTFANHVAATPVCGPSRSSLLQGRYVHNTRYYMNGDLASIANYEAIQNDSVGTWFTEAGYHTAFLGKYVNNLEHDVVSGWSHW
eukprot:gene6117-5970_t